MSIKRVDPNAVFKVVCRFDDALEHETAEELKTDQKDDQGKEVLKQSRYDKFLETLNLSDLKFKPDVKPTIFHLRCLKTKELANLNTKYLVVDTKNKTMDYRDYNSMVIEYFEKGVVGIEAEDGKLEKISPDDLEFKVVNEVGSIVLIMTSVSKNQKKS